MNIKLVEFNMMFSEENIHELERFLSKLPYSHLKSLDCIEKVFSLNGAIAGSSPFGCGGEIRLTDKFYYELDSTEREFVFLHEIGHNYYDFTDENEGNRSSLKLGPCKKEDVSNLLRVQWMDLGLWELDPLTWRKINSKHPDYKASRDKYTFMAMCSNPNCELGEWVCPKNARIPKNPNCQGLKYDKSFYSPKEEMADAYALFLLDKDHFLRSAETNDVVKAKYEFTKRHFKNNSSGVVNLLR